ARDPRAAAASGRRLCRRPHLQPARSAYLQAEGAHDRSRDLRALEVPPADPPARDHHDPGDGARDPTLRNGDRRLRAASLRWNPQLRRGDPNTFLRPLETPAENT